MEINVANIYIPKYKYELINALSRFYPNDRSFMQKSKKQLYAIYFNVRKGLGR